MEFEVTKDFLPLFFVHGKFVKGTFDLADGSTPVMREHDENKAGSTIHSYRNTRV